MQKPSLSPRWINEVDLALCLRCNRVSHFRFWRVFFKTVSRLGDGVFWYTLMALLPLAYGPAAWPTVARMAIAGLLGLAVYKWLKERTSRPRPYQVYSAISAAAPALDRFSFPSGHTLHAVTFSLVAASSFPQLAPLVYPFAFLVALSRPVLGLHYPSDVLAGALLGVLAAQAAALVC
ncbi:MAG: phosphatase PAP2 family protein [Ignavibacteria bacterium]